MFYTHILPKEPYVEKDLFFVKWDLCFVKSALFATVESIAECNRELVLEVRQLVCPCSTLQHTATYCNSRLHQSILQHTATYYSILQQSSKRQYGGRTARATPCSTLQCTATVERNRETALELDHWLLIWHTAPYSAILQHTATYRNIPQHTATYRNIPQHTTTYCNSRVQQRNSTGARWLITRSLDGQRYPPPPHTFSLLSISSYRIEPAIQRFPSILFPLILLPFLLLFLQRLFYLHTPLSFTSSSSFSYSSSRRNHQIRRVMWVRKAARVVERASSFSYSSDIPFSAVSLSFFVFSLSSTFVFFSSFSSCLSLSSQTLYMGWFRCYVVHGMMTMWRYVRTLQHTANHCNALQHKQDCLKQKNTRCPVTRVTPKRLVIVCIRIHEP